LESPIRAHIMQKRIVIYEDSRQLRDSVAQLIDFSKDYVLAGSFPNVLDVERQIRELQPDIVLMDIDLPGGISGIHAVRKIRAFDPRVAIIMLTVFDDNASVFDAIYAGASGYLLKKHLSERLFGAMEEVLSGGAPMSPGVARMVISSMQARSPAVQDKYQMTPREKEILAALAKGTGYKMIAAQLHISLDTVRSHVKNIYQKMQAHSQLEAIAKARDAGIV
jgi:DNA-binding NarL/FixJ family response regulator